MVFIRTILRGIITIPWISRQAVLADGENYFEEPGLCSLDGQFYWGVDVEALKSRV